MSVTVGNAELDEAHLCKSHVIGGKGDFKELEFDLN